MAGARHSRRHRPLLEARFEEDSLQYESNNQMGSLTAENISYEDERASSGNDYAQMTYNEPLYEEDCDDGPSETLDGGQTIFALNATENDPRGPSPRRMTRKACLDFCLWGTKRTSPSIFHRTHSGTIEIADSIDRYNTFMYQQSQFFWFNSCRFLFVGILLFLFGLIRQAKMQKLFQTNSYGNELGHNYQCCFCLFNALDPRKENGSWKNHRKHNDHERFDFSQCVGLKEKKTCRPIWSSFTNCSNSKNDTNNESMMLFWGEIQDEKGGYENEFESFGMYVDSIKLDLSEAWNNFWTTTSVCTKHGKAVKCHSKLFGEHWTKNYKTYGIGALSVCLFQIIIFWLLTRKWILVEVLWCGNLITSLICSYLCVRIFEYHAKSWKNKKDPCMHEQSTNLDFDHENHCYVSSLNPNFLRGLDALVYFGLVFSCFPVLLVIYQRFVILHDTDNLVRRQRLIRSNRIFQAVFAWVAVISGLLFAIMMIAIALRVSKEYYRKKSTQVNHHRLWGMYLIGILLISSLMDMFVPTLWNANWVFGLTGKHIYNAIHRGIRQCLGCVCCRRKQTQHQPN